jgi:hypothetical protein
VPGDVVVDEAGHEEIRMIVSFLHPYRGGDIRLAARFVQQVGL